MTFEIDRDLLKRGLEEALKNQLNLMEGCKGTSDMPRDFYLAQTQAFGTLRVRCVSLGTDVKQYDVAYREMVSTFPEQTLRDEALRELTR